jgi:GTP-binding protein EngB required for normal cell division
VCLDVKFSNTERGAVVWTYAINHTRAQQWRLTPEGYLESALNGMVLDIWQSSKANGAKVILHTKHGGSNQKWRYENEMLVSQMHGKVLDLHGDSKGPETPMHVWTAHGGSNQKWKFVELEDTKHGSSSLETVQVVVSGNPGVGKSTVLNSILGREHFVSDISHDGAGVTKQISLVRGPRNTGFSYILVDTPGISEVARQGDNMKMLIKAISGRVNTKVLFIVTEEAGRVKPADVLLFQLILDHVGAVNCENVVLVVNKVSPQVMERAEKLKSVYREQFGVSNDNIFLIPFVNEGSRLLLPLPFQVVNLRTLQNGTWNEIARMTVQNQQEEADLRRRQAEIEEENRQKMIRIQEQNAREVARLQRQADSCSIL